jgi:cyclohexa-1,5-dienecarbonyl-CoA hydratase
LTVSNPPLNILTLEALTALSEAIDALGSRQDLQVLVVHGAGHRAFSAGVAVEDHVADKIEPTLQTFHRALRTLYDLPMVTIAAGRGHCLGGGLELAAVCDLIVASAGSKFGVPEIKLGCYPPVAAALYPQRIGWDRALDLMLTGRTLNAAEAERWGLVTRVVADEDYDRVLEELITTLDGNSVPVSRLLKRAARLGEALPFEQALPAAEALYLTELVATDDMHEGIASFMERRQPTWKHH